MASVSNYLLMFILFELAVMLLVILHLGKWLKAALKRIFEGMGRIYAVLLDISVILGQGSPIAVRATLTIQGESPDMPATIKVGKTGQATFKEFNAGGVELQPEGTVEYSSSDPSLATVDASGLVTVLAAGTFTINGLDSVNRLSAGDTGTGQDVATSATLTLTAVE